MPTAAWFLRLFSTTEVAAPALLWLETYCIFASNTANRGTEVDWQWFFYNIHRLSGANNYSLDDIARVYSRAAHGGASTWAELVASAASAFPGAKGQLWATAGTTYGVRR